jgi:DNA-binding transcriptional ArsR family regulator
MESAEDYLVEVFRALGDPLRMEIMRRMSQTDELACTELEEILPVTKSTISYHVKVLSRAGLLHVRKEGRYYFYHARHDLIDELMPDLWGQLATLGAETEPAPKTPKKKTRQRATA